MKTKTSLKNRIVSALLAITMVMALLPAGMFTVAQATNIMDGSAGSVTQNTANFAVTFNIPDKGNTGLGSYRIVLVPDTSKDGKESVPSALAQAGYFSDQNGSAVESTIGGNGAPPREYYGYHDQGTYGQMSFTNNSVTFTIEMPQSFKDTVNYLADNGFIKKDGSTCSRTDTSIPMVALFYQQQGIPTAAIAMGTWTGENRANIEISGGPINAFGPATTTINAFQTEMLTHPLTLTNTGGEDAVISTIIFGAPSYAAVGAANYWGLWTEEEGTYTPIKNGATGNSGSTNVIIKPGESIVVYMQRRAGMSGTNLLVRGSGTTATLKVVNETLGQTSNGGTITVNYTSQKDSSVTETGKTAVTSWTYRSGGGYNNTTLKVSAPQWRTNSETGTVKRTGTDESIPITQAQIISASGSNAKVTISGFVEGGEIVVDADGTPVAIANKTATGDLTVKLEPRDTSVVSTWTGTLEITYGDTDSARTAKVILTVEVTPTVVDDIITVYKDGSVWNGTDTPTIQVRKSGTAVNIDAASSADGVFTFHLDAGNYEIYDDDGPTGVTFTKVGGESLDERVDYYTVSVSADPAAGGSVWIGDETTDNGVTSDVVLKGNSVTIHAVANSGYSFTNWTGTDGTLSSATISRTINGTKTYTANFDSSSVTITVLLDGAGDTAGKEVQLVNGSTTYVDGLITNTTNKGVFTLTAVPTGTYKVQVKKSGSNEWDEAGDLTVTAAGGSATVNYYTYVLKAGTGGTVSDGSVVFPAGTTSGEYLEGTAVSAVATPDVGYKFVKWHEGTSATGTAVTPPTSLTERTELFAEFALIGIKWENVPQNQTLTYGETLNSLSWNAVPNETTNAKYPITYTVENNGGLGDYIDFTLTDTTSTVKGGITAVNKTGEKIPAGTYTIKVKASDGVSDPIEHILTITVAKQKLKAPAITKVQDVTVAGGSDGIISFPDPAYPADANVSFVLVKDTNNTAETVDGSRQYTGLAPGDYYVQATIGDPKNYEWDKDGGNSGKSNEVEITEPGVNNPTLTETPTYEKNPSITGRAAAVFNFTVGDWTTLSGLKIGNATVDLSGCTIDYTAKSITIPLDVLDALTLANGEHTVTATFSRVGITPLEATATSKMNVKTTYTVSFNLNGGTAATTGAPSIANKATTTATAPTFMYKDIANNAPTKTGYAFAGWSTDADDTTAEWHGNKTAYIPATDVTDTTKWNTTVKAVWTPNVVEVTVKKDGTAAADGTKAVTLVDSTTGTTLTVTTTTSNGVTTFTGVPVGTYKIHVDGADTNHTVTAVAGTKATASLYYYTVDYASLADATKHGKYSDGAGGTADTHASGEVLAGGMTTGTPGTDKNLNFVNLPGTVADTNYVLDSWTQSRAVGAFNGTGNHANATKWTVNNDTSTGGAITLTPAFARSGYAVTVTVKKDNVLQGSNAATAPSVTVKLSGGPSGFTPVQLVTDANGTVVFNGLKAGGYTITVNDGTEDWRDTKTVTVAAADQTVDLEYFTVTAVAGTGAASASVTNPTTTRKIVMKGKTAGLTSSPADGYNNPVTWTLTKTNGAGTSSMTGNTLTVNDTVTATASYEANTVILTTKLNGNVKGGYELTLYNGTTATAFTGTTGADGTVKFTVVPAGTYKIYDKVDGTDTDTGVTVVVKSGSANDGGSAEIRYYDVNYLDVTSTNDHGIYTGVTSPDVPKPGNVIINSTSNDRRKVDLPGTTADTNYKHNSWTLSPTTGVGTAPAATATTWTATQSTTYNAKGAITLKPVFTKDKATITVVVKRNGQTVTDSIAVELTNQTPKTTTTGTAVFDSLSAGTYTAGVTGWTTSDTTTKTATIGTTDATITLNYFDYAFDANKPAAATANVEGMPTNPTAPVLTGYSLDYPTEPTLAGYTFQGWGTTADQTSSLWTSGTQSITGERTYYAIWTPNTVSLTDMTAYGGLNITGIRGFTVNKGTGTGHNSDTDFTYEVWDGTKWADTCTLNGVTLTAGTGLAFAAASVPNKVGTVANPETTIEFRVRAVSTLNGQVSATVNTSATKVTVTVYPTYTVEYVKNSGGNDTSVSDTLPTDNNLYVVSDKDFTGATGPGSKPVVAKTITASSPTLTWTGGVKTQEGWASSATGSTATSFTVSTVAKAQNKKPGETLTLYAIWIGDDLTFNSKELQADYNMNGDQWKASSYYTAGQTPDLDLTGLYLPDLVSNKTDPANLTFTVTDIPSFMEYDAATKTLKLKDGTRIGDVAEYTINVTVSDSGNVINGNPASHNGTIKLTVHKTTPVIVEFKKDPASVGPYYTGDVVWPETTYTEVHDPYDVTKILSTPTTNPDGNQWSDKAQTFKTGENTYSYTYTPEDGDNYNTPDDVSVTFEAAVRVISLQVKDDDKNAAWSNKYTNSNTPTYDPTENWKTVKVSIRNPAGSNSPIDKLTWTQKAGSGDDTFKNIKIVQADGSTARPSPSTLAAGDTGEYILTFEVNVNASGSHTLTFQFDGVAGEDGQPSRKTAQATYTYTTVAQANTLETPDPDLTRVEVNDGIDHPDGSNDDLTNDYTGLALKDQNGNTLDEKLGGLHLVFAPIDQDTGTDVAGNPVKEYTVTVTGGGKTLTATVKPGAQDADGNYHYYWPADLTNGPIPGTDCKVEVQAITRDSSLYTSSGVGEDEVKNEDGNGGAGWRELTIDMLEVATRFTDRVFNGLDQDGGGTFRLKKDHNNGVGAGTISVKYADNVGGDNKTTKKQSVNLTENTDPKPSDGTNPDHDYYIYVEATRGDLYLALSSTQYTGASTNTVDAKHSTANGNINTGRTSPHADWEIVQAPAAMGFVKGAFTGETDTPTDIRPQPYVTYTTNNGALYNDGDKRITSYYDISYVVVSSPSTNYPKDKELTVTDLQTFVADTPGLYTFKAIATYKTAEAGAGFPNTQFQADVSEVAREFTFSTDARTVDQIILERYQAVNGTTGVANVDKDLDDQKNLTEDRLVTYGNKVEATTDRIGYYDATDAGKAKEMRLEGLRITVKWSSGPDSVYVVGQDTLPTGATWTGVNTNVADTPALTDGYLTFKGAGVNKNFNTNLTFSYGGKTSNAVTYTMEKRPIDYKVVSDDEKIWNNSPKVKGEIQFELPDNLTGDDVKIVVNGDQFQTTNVKYDKWVTDGSNPYGPDVKYTADSNVGKDKIVRAQKVGNSGSGSDVTGTDKAFYKRGNETPGKATIKPARVTKTNVTLTEPSANTLNGENLLSNNRYKPRTDGIEDELQTRSGWSVPVVSIKWESWDEATGSWVEVTDHFSIDTVYRATVVVNADTNHYMHQDEIDNYTIRGKKNGDYAIEDLDDWNNREENKVTVTVDQSGPFHPDWAPGEVLYHNRTTFTYVFHTFETPSLQFSDEKASFDPEAPSTGTDHEPSSYVHHTETVNEGAGSMTYTITVNAAVKDIFGAQVLMTNKELINAGAELKVVQGNGTIDVATPVRTEKDDPMLKVNNELYDAKKDLIIYELTIPSSVTSKAGIYHLEFQAMGSTSLANLEAGKVDVAKSYYTFTLEVLKKQDPPVISGGGEVELPVVTYWLSSYGSTDDMTAEKMTRKGGKPSFVPKVTPVSGLRFLGWSEVDPATLKDGKLPTLVDPLTFSIHEDKVFYAVYERVEVGHTHYVIGFPDGTFGPDNPITRGQVATIIARSCLEDFVEGGNYGNPGDYTDVEKHWANSAIAYCSMKGVFTGYEDGTFRPDRYITRQELATVVARLAGVVVNEGLPFSDSEDISAWALNGIYTNYVNGWVNGYTDGTFKPLNNITRAETVKIFNGYLGRGVDREGLSELREYVHSGTASNIQDGTDEYMTWPDVAKNHWAYYEIIEAANDHNFRWRDTTKAAPPEDWYEAFIDATWRYVDDANDGADSIGRDEVPVFTVTYVVKSNGVTWDSVTEEVKKFESPDPSKLPQAQPSEGYRFLGWSDVDPDTGAYNLMDPTASPVLEDRTFYAIFEPKLVITYVIGEHGSTDQQNLSERINKGESPTTDNLPQITAHQGWRFAGWSETDPATGVISLTDPTDHPAYADSTFYATYEREGEYTMPQVTVTYVLGDQGSSDGVLTQTFDQHESPKPELLPQVTAGEGWTFLGWSETDPAAGEFVLMDPTAQSILADKSFYAVYEAVAPTDETQQPTDSPAPTEPEESVEPEPEVSPEPTEPLPPVEGTDPQPTEPAEPVEPEEPTEPLPPVEYTRYSYINGYTDNTFRPDAAFTRAAVATVLANLMGYDPELDYDGGTFTDLEGHWAAKAIGFCASEGLMSGYTDDTFRPDNAISRQEFAMVLTRLTGETESGDLPFTDADDVAPWAADSVYTVYNRGWISGYDDGTFLPQRDVTRAEAVKMLNGYLDRAADRDYIESQSGYTIWADVPETHWAYYEIIEASNNWL